MPLRTPHRRISPRTKRRCRAIKEFFKKTIGTLSQTDNRTHSSIIVSVSDLKSKINILEQHLDKVSKHCRDLSFLEHSKGESTTSHEIKQVTPSKLACEGRTRDTETKILYETPRKNYIKSESQSINKWDSNETSMNAIKNSHRCNKEYFDRPFNLNDQYDRQLKFSKQSPHLKAKPENKLYEDNIKRVYSSISLQSPRETYNNDETCDLRYKHSHRHRKDIEKESLREYGNAEKIRHDNKRDTEHRKTRKKSHHHSKVDEDFIADIIRKQYKPVKLFGRRLSDFSQFSAPVCRDQEFTIQNDVMEGSELCSCCFEGHRKVRHRHCEQYNFSDMRSICDARLYTSKKQRRYKQSHINNYNDSNLYDLVPVKEKSSPKSRRKFIEENNKRHERCREVLPSPRTNRPRLNLKAQRYAYDDMILPNGTHRSLRKKLPVEMTDDCSDLSQYRQTIGKGAIKPQDGGTMSSLQYSNLEPEQVNINNETINTPVTSSTVDKTDKALCEIKDILQSFLQEIKRESIHSHSELSSKSIKQSQTHLNDESNSNTIPKNHQSSFINNNTAAQCLAPPIVSTFNPCCYPVLPICPINYSPNSFMVPSPSYTCATCTHNCQETASHDNNVIKTSTPPCQHETQELIKEIYKCVARNSNTPHGRRSSNENIRHMNVEKKILTSRSVGSSKASKHDAMVETPKMKCYSKSCEAIGSRMTSDSCYSTNPTLSETVIEKLNLETSRSSSETEMDRICEAKKNKFSRVLNRFGLFKRKKKDVIEEVSESESTVEVDVMPHTRSPFKQNILNYNVHAQQFLHRPPKGRCCPAHDTLHQFACGDDHSREFPNIYKHGHHPQGHSTPQCCQMSRPPCCHEHNQHNHTAPQIPQLPLCLKEIEVKSIGTQSDRKLSIFPRFKKKLQSPQMQLQQHNTMTTQTPQERNILLNWEKLKQKAAKNVSSNSDPNKFSIKTRKDLALGDTKMRNAMLKKLFYKRNPFSPRNLIIRTLLGKDKSSWGDPPRMYKPRMFI